MSHDSDPAASKPRLPVMHVINGEHYSGAERVQDLLAARLPEFGFDVSFACVKPNRFDSMRHFRDAPIHNIPMRARVDMRPVWRLVNILRQNGTTLLHAHTPRSLIVARLAAIFTGLPLVYHVHSPTARDTTQPLRNWLNNTTERFSLKGVNRLITVSESLRQHMCGEGFDPERVVTVPNGVPVIPSLPTRTAPQGTWTIGTLALFRPRKGLEVLLDAIAHLQRQDLPVRLRAVGRFESSDYEAQVRGKARDLAVEDSIEWVGFRQDVNAELARMDVFVLPSLFGEGLPMVVLEAMAAGVPVVATRVEGVPEAIRDGLDGVLAEPHDAAGLAHSIRSLTAHPSRWLAIRTAAITRHAEHFSDRRMAEQVADVYHHILVPNPAAGSPVGSSCRNHD